MNDESKEIPVKPKPPLSQQVGSKAVCTLKARQDSTQGVWFGLGMMGLVGGDSDAARRGCRPLVGPALSGGALLVAGLAIGCWNAWHWVTQEDRAMRDDEGNDHE